MGTFILTQVHFLWKNCTFTSLLWVTLLSLLYLNAIQFKNASIYSKHAIYFSLGNERCPRSRIIHSFEPILFECLIKPVNRFVNQFEWFVQFPAARAESSDAVLTLSCNKNIKSVEDVALDLQSVESKSAKAMVC